MSKANRNKITPASVARAATGASERETGGQQLQRGQQCSAAQQHVQVVWQVRLRLLQVDPISRYTSYIYLPRSRQDCLLADTICVRYIATFK